MAQDRVHVDDQERLDRPDFDALQTLVYTAQNLLVGGLLGASSGLLSPLDWEKSNDGITYLLTLDRFMAVHTSETAVRVEDRGASGAVNVGAEWESVIQSFDPNAAGHSNHPINYTAARAAEIATPGTQPYIWVRPIDSPADVDVRRVWSVATGAETPTDVNTRTRQRMEFAVSETTPPLAGGAAWAAIARVWAWAGNDLDDVDGLSAWDDEDTAEMLQDPGTYGDYASENTSFGHPLRRLLESGDVRGDGSTGWPPGTGRAAGLAYHFQWLRSRIQRLISGGTGDGVGTVVHAWWKPPEISLNGAKLRMDGQGTLISLNTAAIALNTAAIAATALQVSKNNQRQEILCSGVLAFHVGGGVWAPPYHVAGWGQRHGWGIEDVVMGGLEAVVSIQFKPSLVVGREAWYISSVQANPVGTPLASREVYHLIPEMLPTPGGDPALFPGAGPLDLYKGATVGLAAGLYGIRFGVLQTLVDAAGPALISQPVGDGVMPGLTFSVEVVLSKFRGADAGV